MSDSTIKISLAVDGERKFKTAMKEAASAVQSVDARLQAATAEFKRDGDAMKLQQQRSEALREEIDRQSEIVKALQGAVKDATTAYGENSAQALRWEGEMNRARVKLLSLQTALDYNAAGLDEHGKAFQTAAELATDFENKLKRVETTATASKYSVAIQGIQQLTNSLTGSFNQLKSAAASAWGQIEASSEWADDLATRSLQTGLSVEELQKWDYAAKLVDTDVDTIQKALTKLVNPSSAVQEALQSLNISPTKQGDVTWEKTYLGLSDGQEHTVRRYATVQKTSIELFWETVDALSAMQDAAKRESAANEIFGQSYQQLLPLIQAGREEWERYGEEFAQNGGVLAGSQVDALTSFNDSLQRMNSETEALKNTLAAEFAPAAATVAEAVSTVTEALSSFLQSDAGQKAIESITGFLSSVAQFAADNPTAAIAGTVAALGGLQLIKVAPSLVSTLALLKTFGGAAGASAAVSAAGSAVAKAASASAAAAPAVSAAAPAAASAAAKLGAGVIKYSPYGLWGTATYAVAKGLDAYGVERDFGDFNRAFDTGELEEAVQQAAGTLYANAISALLKGMDAVDEGESNDLLQSVFRSDEYREVLRQALPDLEKILADAEWGDTAPDWYQHAADAILQLKELSQNAGEEADTALSAGVTANAGVAEEAAKAAGAAVGNAYGAGIQSSYGAVQTAIGAMLALGSVSGGSYAAPRAVTAGSGATYNQITTMNIDKYNQYSSQDVTDLMNAMAEQQGFKRRGVGN